MQGMIGMSKKDLIEFINENFSEYHENDTIATDIERLTEDI